MKTRIVAVITDSQAFLLHAEWRRGSYVLEDCRHCGVPRVVLPREADDLNDLAETVGRNLGPCNRGDAIYLVFPTSWCFIREMDLSPQKWTQQAAEFALEEYLPVDLEELTCTTRRLGHGRGLIAAVFTEALKGFLHALNDKGLPVEIMTPDLELLYPALSTGGNERLVLHDQTRRTMLISGRSGEVHTIRNSLHNGSVDDRKGSAGAMGFDPLTPGGTNRRVWDISGPPVDAGTAGTNNAATAIGCPLYNDLLSSAISGGELLNVRVDHLAYAGRFASLQYRTQALLCAATLMAASWSLEMHLNRRQYQSAVADLQPEIAEAYRAAFGGASPPPGAALRLRSERIKLQGLTGTDHLSPVLNTAGPIAFELLHAATAAIPPGMKLNLSEVIIEEDELRFAGQTTSHEAAGEWVSALNQAGTLTAEPPRTKLRRDKTVDFRIRATRATTDGT